MEALFSHLDIACEDTFSAAARVSCVMFFSFRNSAILSPTDFIHVFLSAIKILFTVTAYVSIIKEFLQKIKQLSGEKLIQIEETSTNVQFFTQNGQSA